MRMKSSILPTGSSRWPDVRAAIGAVVGRLVHGITGLPAGVPGLLIGAAFGFQRDLMADEIEIKVSKVIGEEFEKHTGERKTTAP